MSAADERELVLPWSPVRIREALARRYSPDAVAAGYGDARAEAFTACRGLGLLFGRQIDGPRKEIGDIVRTAYVGGWEACESRLAAPDMADQIARAMDLPGSVIERKPGESDRQLTVRAIQQVIAYGLAKR